MTDRVISDVQQERSRQNAKWGEQNHNPFVWLAILTEEVGELAESMLPDTIEDMRTEAIHVAAVAVAFVEYLDRTKQIRSTDLQRKGSR